MKIPDDLETVLANIAKSLNRTFHLLGSLNGAKDAPMPERNTVVHCGGAFLKEGYGVYAEASFPSENRRIDLLASKGNLTFVCEVKTFGKLNMSGVLADVERVKNYFPAPDERLDGKELEFWEKSKHWGVVLIQSFAGDEFTKLWTTQIDKPEVYKERLYQYPCRKNSNFYKTGRKEFKELTECLRKYGASVGAKDICDGIWKEAESLKLLWAAFPRE